MEIKKIKGIIISEISFKETSKIINVLTEEYGKIGIIAKGAKGIKSPLRSVSTKLTYGYFHISYRKDGLSGLISVDVLNEFKNIRTDLYKIGCANYLLDLTNQVLKETENSSVFLLLESALLKIETGFDSLVITNIIELKYLEFLGVMPILDRCSICGKTENIVTISGDDGGYICKSCYNNHYLTDEKTTKLLRMFCYVDISKIKEINIKDRNKTEINRFLEDYYLKYTGLYLKSKSFLKQII